MAMMVIIRTMSLIRQHDSCQGKLTIHYTDCMVIHNKLVYTRLVNCGVQEGDEEEMYCESVMLQEWDYGEWMKL